MRIVPDDLSNPQVAALLAVHLAHMRGNSPACSVHALEVEGLRSPTIHMFTAWEDDQLMGMGALKVLSETDGEVKSMRTDERFVRRGVAVAILERIISEARMRGMANLSLETGTGPAFDAAHALYARFGFQPCGPFADYGFDPFSVFYTLSL